MEIIYCERKSFYIIEIYNFLTTVITFYIIYYISLYIILSLLYITEFNFKLFTILNLRGTLRVKVYVLPIVNLMSLCVGVGNVMSSVFFCCWR